MSTLISKGVVSTLATLPSSTLSDNITSSQTHIPLVSTTNFSSYTTAKIASTSEVVSYTGTAENFNTYSTDLSTGYAANACTKTLNEITAPDGTNTGTLITASTASPQDCYLRYNVTLTAGTQHTTSVYAKAGTSNFVSIRAVQVGSPYPYAWFNLSTGTVGTTQSPLTASISDAGNGWYRCSITYTTQSPTVTYTINDINIGQSDGSNATVNGKSIYVWGLQTNLGSTAKTFIPTTSSVPIYALTGVTRGANSTTAASATSGATVTVIDNNINKSHFVNCVATAGATTIRVTDISDTTLGELYLHNSGDSIIIEKSPSDNILLVGGGVKAHAVGSPRS
jgi:hypothetical protein